MLGSVYVSWRTAGAGRNHCAGKSPAGPSRRGDEKCKWGRGRIGKRVQVAGFRVQVMPRIRDMFPEVVPEP
jgi:hypothetical protein